MSQRTILQNSAMHKFFALLAEHLNGAGFGMKAVFEIKNVEVDWTPEAIKEALWKPLQIAMLDKKSTAELSRSEVSQVHEQLMKALGESKLAVPYLEFPSETGE
jgi:hypothetical protein